MARFIVQVVDQMNISGIESQYTGGGSEGSPPKMLIALIFTAIYLVFLAAKKLKKRHMN